MNSCFSRPYPCKPQAGFTLIELIVTLILIGILAVVALPRFIGKQGYEEVTVRDELTNKLRLVQMRAMNAPSTTCHQLVIEAEQLGVAVNTIASGNPCPAVYGTLQNVTPLDDVTVTTGRISFNRLGQPTESCAGGCDLLITGEGIETVRIESEGFVHAL